MEKPKRFQNRKLNKSNNKVQKAVKGTKTGLTVLGIGAGAAVTIKKYGKDVVRVVRTIASR